MIDFVKQLYNIFIGQIQMYTVKKWLKLGQFPFACQFLKQIPTI